MAEASSRPGGGRGKLEAEVTEASSRSWLAEACSRPGVAEASSRPRPLPCLLIHQLHPGQLVRAGSKNLRVSVTLSVYVIGRPGTERPERRPRRLLPVQLSRP